MTTFLDKVREKEKDVLPEMYACYRIGHVVSPDGLCMACLRVIPKPPEEDAD